MARSRYKFKENQNPVKRGYIDEALYWRYSSARNYAENLGLLEVCTDWNHADL